jgi:outer membrane protein
VRDKKAFALSPLRAQFVVVFLGGLGACSSIYAQSLMDVYQKAKQSDTQYNAARRMLEVGLEKSVQGRAGLLPTMNAVGAKNHQMGDASFSEAPYVHRDVRNWNWSMQVTQPIIRFGNVAAYAQGNAQTRQAQEQFMLAEQDLMVRVAQAYFDCQMAQESVQVARAQVQAIGEQLTLAERTFQVGTGTITDVHEAKAKHALAKAQHVAAENDVQTKQAELERVVGEQLTLPSMRLMQDLPSLQGGVNEWLAAAVSGNPQIKIQQAALDVAHQEVNKSYAAHAPTLDFVANKGSNYGSGSLSSPADLSTRVNSFQRGIQLNIPLFAGGATQSKVRESLALEEKAREDLLGAQRQASSSVRQAYAGVVNGQAQVMALEVAVEAGRNAVESNKIGFTIGTRINPDVLSAEQQLYAAMRDLSKARADAAMQGLKLKAAAGVLTPDDLQALERSLEEVQKNEKPAPAPIKAEVEAESTVTPASLIEETQADTAVKLDSERSEQVTAMDSPTETGNSTDLEQKDQDDDTTR